MGLFKRNKKEEMELPPPPPLEEGGLAAEFPDMPTAEEAHIPSEMPEIKAADIPFAQEPSPAMTGAPIETPQEEEEMGIPMERERISPSEAPYVNVSDFQQVMTNVGLIRDVLKEADGRVNRLNEIKNIEEKELEKWRNQLEDIERKLSYIDGVIAKGA